MVGAGTCYLLRAGSVSTCKAVVDEMMAEKNSYADYTDEHGAKERLMDKEDKFI